ncbi:prestin [Ciona intestinalis]
MATKVDEPSDTILIRRKTFTEEKFQDKYELDPVLPKELTLERLKRKSKEYYHKKKENPCKSTRKYIAGLIPIFTWLSHYKLRAWIVPDIISGITVGVMQIPQGMSYALLAGQHPIYGLYTAFFPVLLYAVFGTSRHTSMGSFAITSLMLGSAVSSAVPDPTFNQTTPKDEQDILWKEVYDERILFGAAAALIGGIFLLGLSILNLGIIVIYLSDPMVSGFTCGNAVQVFVSQLKGLFGVSAGSYSGPLNIIWVIRDVIVNLTTLDAEGRTRVSATVVISAICVIFLLGVKEINERYKKKLPLGIPIPGEIIVVIVGTGVSYGADLAGNFNVDIIGDIPSGLPVPKPPPTDKYSSVVGYAIPIAIIGYAVAVSMAKIFGNTFGYKIRPNQELVAYGVSNIVSSFFFCFPAFPSMSRSCVQVDSGGKTQLVAILSALLMLLVLLWIGPVFASIPNACLASIVAVAIKGMLRKARDLPPIWRISKLDGITWMLAMLATVFLDVILGLVVGVLVSLLCVVFRTQMVAAERLAHVDDTEVYRKAGSFKKPVEEDKDIVVIAFRGALHFANKQFLAKSIMTSSGIDPGIELSRKKKLDAIRKKAMQEEEESLESVSVIENGGTTSGEITNGGNINGGVMIEGNPHVEGVLNTVDAIVDELDKPKRVQCIVLDCSQISFMDCPGVKFINKTFEDYRTLDVTMLLANVCSEVAHVLKVGGFIEKFGDDVIFLSVLDAVTWWQSRATRDTIYDDDFTSTRM